MKKTKYKNIKYLAAVFYNDAGEKIDSAVLLKINSRYPQIDKYVKVIRTLSYYPNKKIIHKKYRELDDLDNLPSEYVPHKKSKQLKIKIYEEDRILKFNSDDEAKLWFALNTENIIEDL